VLLPIAIRPLQQRSMSMRNQEEELSILCTSSPIQEIFLRPDVEEMDLELPSTTVNEDISHSKQPCNQSDVSDTTGSAEAISEVQRDSTDTGVRLESFDSDYNAVHANPTEDLLFVDDREESDSAETRTFPNQNQSEPQRKLSRSSCGRLDRLTSQTSFIAELQKLASGREAPEVTACSGMADRSVVRRKAHRRQSKFKSIGNTRNIGESAPRMSAKDRRLLQMILVIFVSFLVCYLPITITKLLQDAIDWRGLNIAGYILIYLTTCINPIIYVVMSSEYRNAYKYVLLCKRERLTNKKRRSAGLLKPG